MTRRLCLFVFACVHPEKLKFSLFSCVNIFGRKQNRLHSLSVTSRPPNTTQHAKPAQQGTASPPRERAAAGPARPSPADCPLFSPLCSSAATRARLTTATSL